MLGMHGTVYANYAINEADLLLALGVRFDDRVTGKVERVRQARQDRPHRHRPVARSTRTRRPTCPIDGDVGHALRRPDRRCSTPSRPSSRSTFERLASARSTHWRETEPLRYADRDDAILPQYAIERLWQILQATAASSTTRSSTTGVGQHQMWAAQYLRSSHSRGRWITSGGLGSMGFGLPAAMGAQAAHPAQDGHRHRRRRQLPDEHPGAGLRLHREAAGQGAAAQQPAPGHGGAVGGPLLRRQPRPHLPRRRRRRGAVPRLRDASPRASAAAPPDLASRATWTRRWRRCSTATGPYVLDVLVPYQEHVLPMIPGGHDGARHHQGVMGNRTRLD